MKLIVGLGNPGDEYINTRHNIGFQLLDFIAEKNGVSFSNDKKFNAMIGQMNINNEKVLLVKPLSFMNLSGTVVGCLVRFYHLEAKDILVVQDDLDMEFGKIRILYNSSSGGHNGIKNIIEVLGTKEFTRLKIGISNNKKMDTKDYVLGKFSVEEKELLSNIYDKLSNLVYDFVSFDIDKMKQIYNSMNN